MTVNFTILKSSADLKRYFSPVGHDYYVENSKTHAFFGGNLKDRLGLKEFDIEQFHALCDGNHPFTGEKLTPGRREGARAGWDVTVDGPKDLGVLAALGMDDRIIPEVLERAAKDLAAIIEADAQTRVRIGKKDTDRHTGNVIYSGVLHTVARPVTLPDGSVKIDMQPHLHLLFHNVTWDPVEKRMKALQLQPFAANGSKEARPFYTAYFNSQLARYAQQLGYRIEQTKDSFRVVGVPESVRKQFSQRTAKINAVASDLAEGKKDWLEKQREEQGQQPWMDQFDTKLNPAVKGKLGAHTRERKQPGTTWESLLDHWNSRVSDEERQAVLDTVIRSQRNPGKPLDRHKEAVQYALDHLLERNSAVPQRQLVTEALKHGLGGVTLEGVYAELGKRRDLIRRKMNGVDLVSTQAVLAEEKAIIAFAKQGRGKYKPLGKKGGTIADTLSPSQQAAIRHVWSSPDRLVLVRGSAGTGKTTLTKTALAGVKVPWVILAPSAEASRGVLRRDGFENADTLAAFLNSETMQQRVRGGLIWLDEASLAGAKDLHQLTELAGRLNARVVLSGDRRQHKSVARGDVLGLLEDGASLPVAEVSDIKRQSGEYKRAVELLAKGKAAEGVKVLDQLGWVKEAGLVDDYLAAIRDKKSVLVVSPTHIEGEAITAAIRDRLKQEGKLGEEHQIRRLVPLNWTRAQMAEARKAGVEPGVVMERYAAYREETQPIAVGDVLRTTASIKDYAGRRIDNGSVLTLTGWTEGGNLRVKTATGVERVLSADVGHIRPGYVATSHAAQGRTVDRVLVSIGEESLAAAGKESAYVSLSRGRQQAVLYTPDKEAMLAAIQREDRRVLASDLVRERPGKVRHRLRKHLAFLSRVGRLGADRGREQEKQTTVEHERG